MMNNGTSTVGHFDGRKATKLYCVAYGLAAKLELYMCGCLSKAYV